MGESKAEGVFSGRWVVGNLLDFLGLIWYYMYCAMEGEKGALFGFSGYVLCMDGLGLFLALGIRRLLSIVVKHFVFLILSWSV